MPSPSLSLGESCNNRKTSQYERKVLIWWLWSLSYLKKRSHRESTKLVLRSDPASRQLRFRVRDEQITRLFKLLSHLCVPSPNRTAMIFRNANVRSIIVIRHIICSARWWNRMFAYTCETGAPQATQTEFSSSQHWLSLVSLCFIDHILVWLRGKAWSSRA